MEDKIREVQNYFIQKIIDKDFSIIGTQPINDSTCFSVRIDERFDFQFVVSPTRRSCYQSDINCFMSLSADNNKDVELMFCELLDKTKEQLKMERIAKLQAELNELQSA